MLRKLYDNFEEYFCALCMAVMVCCLGIQVLLRAFAGTSLAWTEELSRYSFLWTVYVGAALTAKHNGHVRITAQFLLTPPKFRLFMRLVADCLWVGFFLYIAHECWGTLQDGLEFPELSPTLEFFGRHVVKAYVEMIIPGGFLLMCWRIVETWITHCRRGTLYELLREEAS